jgi:hypothetical protein
LSPIMMLWFALRVSTSIQEASLRRYAGRVRALPRWR